jgi:inorganic pyrophosphatase
MRFRVFVENPRGSSVKNRHDERTLTFLGAEPVSVPYPFAYGFVIGTLNEDGDALDCFVITDRLLLRGEVVECEAIGLMHQVEDGLSDDNVLARLTGAATLMTPTIQDALTEFVRRVFSDVPGKIVEVGEFSGPDAAYNEIGRRS